MFITFKFLTNAPFEQEVESVPLTRSAQWQPRLLYLGHFCPSDDAKDLCRSLNEVGPHRDMFFGTFPSWYNCLGRIRQCGLGKRCDPEAVLAGSNPRPFPVTPSLPPTCEPSEFSAVPVAMPLLCHRRLSVCNMSLKYTFTFIRLLPWTWYLIAAKGRKMQTLVTTALVDQIS